MSMRATPIVLRRRVLTFRSSLSMTMVKLKQETGSLAPKRQGNPGIGKLTPHESRVREQVKAKGEITLDENGGPAAHGPRRVCRSRFRLAALSTARADTHTKNIQALEQKCARVARQRHVWITHRQPFMAHMLDRIGFPDETWLKTNMARTTGWAPRGQRLVVHAPFGHWRTQTFVAALRHNRLDAPWVMTAP